ncbi:uncharacterized protein [Atheta coriaria]|uniref:uncharacterized protein isoform X2 n=1 Tax=Dalotia coriaria TaxID=877792 RepID=UPI0031F3A336
MAPGRIILTVASKLMLNLVIVLLILEYLSVATIHASNLVQINATFDTRTIKSGPIFFYDKRTIFISMFEYSHHAFDNMSKHRRWFKVTAANGTQIDMYFIQDIDANQTPAELTRDYQSENIYLRIDESQHDITRFASLVIVGRSDEIVASVDITYANDTIIDGIEQRTTNTNPMFQGGLFVFRYPKCCPSGMYAGSEGCVPMERDPSSRIPIHEKKEEYFNNESMKNLLYEPYFHRPECDDMFILDPSDEVYMLSTGQLISALPHFACLDFIEDEEGYMHEQIFMCAENNINAELKNTIYVGLMYFSAAMLLVWALVLTIMLCNGALSVKTIIVLSILYSVFYSLHFITLATAREIGVVSDTCKIMGYIYQFLLLASFTSLFALIFEGFYRVKHYNKEHSRSRMYFYIGFCAVPIITTLVSIFTNELTLSTTSKIQRDSACWFRSDRKVYSYYVPIICIIFCCMMIQIKTYFDIRENHRKAPALFLLEERKFKNMFRLGAYLNGIMTFCWSMEVAAYYLEAQNNFWFVVDAFNSMQGFAIFCAFSYHYCMVWKKLFTCSTQKIRARSNRSSSLSEWNMRELDPLK